jgi:adenylate cyclase
MTSDEFFKNLFALINKRPSPPASGPTGSYSIPRAPILPPPPDLESPLPGATPLPRVPPLGGTGLGSLAGKISIPRTDILPPPPGLEDPFPRAISRTPATKPAPTVLDALSGGITALRADRVSSIPGLGSPSLEPISLPPLKAPLRTGLGGLGALAGSTPRADRSVSLSDLANPILGTMPGVPVGGPLGRISLPVRAPALTVPPAHPSKWTPNHHQNITDRFERRLRQIEERLDSVRTGRVVPDIEDLDLGAGRQCRLTILFLDICHFSVLPNWKSEEQKAVLALLNLFMSEMISTVRDFDGTFEKNTGDGLMAYFGEGATTDPERVRPAVEAATVMHYFNDHILQPRLDRYGAPRLKFRIGIDVGPVTLARVGAKGDAYNSLVAVGTTANVACKLMTFIPAGGICLGEYAYRNLPAGWAQRCTKREVPTTIVYADSGMPYPAWTLNHRLTHPTT